MKLPVSAYIGLRYNGAKRKNHFISFISVISIGGVSIGVAVLITVLSVMNGFDRELKNRILGAIAHGSIHSFEDRLEDWEGIRETVLQDSDVLGAAPLSQLEVMVAHTGAVSGAQLNGVDPDLEPSVSIVPSLVTRGDFTELQPGQFNIVLGRILAAKLGVVLGDKVTVVLPEAGVSPAGVIPRFKRFTVVGFFEVGPQLDGVVAYINYKDAGKLLRIGANPQALRIQVQDLFTAPEVVRRVAVDTGKPLRVRNWTYSYGQLFQAIKMEKNMIALLLFFIVLIASFNIVSSLVMLVTDKRSDIAVLRTLGASPGMIMKVFMVQGVVVGVFGVALGVGLGLLLASTISEIFFVIQALSGRELLAEYFINYLPSEIRFYDVIVVSIVAFLMCFFATLYPAYKASKVEPAEALRYE